MVLRVPVQTWGLRAFVVGFPLLLGPTCSSSSLGTQDTVQVPKATPQAFIWGGRGGRAFEGGGRRAGMRFVVGLRPKLRPKAENPQP